MPIGGRSSIGESSANRRRSDPVRRYLLVGAIRTNSAAVDGSACEAESHGLQADYLR
jgi:hypothetical protein